MIGGGLSGSFSVLGGQLVQVVDHDVEGLVLVAHASCAQRGSVPWEDAAAEKPGKAREGNSSESFNARKTAVHGEASFVLEDLPPDKYRLRMPMIPAGASVKLARLENHDLLADDLDLTNEGGKGSIEYCAEWRCRPDRGNSPG